MWQQLELELEGNVEPLTFKLGGKRFRFELQTPRESIADACEGCAFQVKPDGCDMRPGLEKEIDHACTDNVSMVWRMIRE